MVPELLRVAELQRQYSSTNTEPMKERGELIRQVLPEIFRKLVPDLSNHMGSTGADLSIDASDGIGRKTQAPWIRFYSKSRSPRPTTGFYVVIHFSIDGERIYVTLGCSSSVWDSEAGDLVQVPNEELDRRIMWMLQTLENAGQDVENFPDIISLGSEVKLPLSFERATALASCFYTDSLEAGEFVACLQRAHELLGAIYEEFDRGSNLTQSEVVRSDVESIANPNLETEAGRQGFRMSAKDRKAVEMRAMELATEHLENMGYKVTEKYTNHPYDLLAENSSESLMVEVKGSTSKTVDAILMTRNEVHLHSSNKGDTALAIVSGIKLPIDGSPSTGGTLEFIHGWAIDEWDLLPLAYEVKRKPSD